MLARESHSDVVRVTVLALSLALAACDGSENPLAPDAAEPVAPEAAAPEAAAPDFLTAGTGPRILFSSARTGGTDIYRMDPYGNNLVRVTSFSGPEQTPAWSWDNTRIAMVRDRLDASNVVHKDIYLMNADGTGKRWARSVTASSDITDPSWSKDGTRLVVSVWFGGDSRAPLGGNGGIPHLMLLNVATGNVNFVSLALGGPIGYTPSFDPTGKKIVYVGEKGQSLEIINADGSGHQTLIGSTRVVMPTGSIIYPKFSPDGKRIAFTLSTAGNIDLYVRNSDGTVKRLTTNAAWDIAPTWSSDGSRIAFSSNRSGKFQIWTMPSNGGTQVRITNTSVVESSPAWSH
jgi:Tol biopolymer transport system component